MTSHLGQLASVTDVSSGGTDPEFKLELARRYEDAYEEGRSSAAAALFAGLFIGAGSTALMIWFATVVF